MDEKQKLLIQIDILERIIEKYLENPNLTEAEEANLRRIIDEYQNHQERLSELK